MRAAIEAVRFHRRLLAPAMAAVALAAGVVAGGVAMGDGLRGALAERTAARLGPLTAAVIGPETGFREAFARNLAADLPGYVVPAYQRDGVLTPEGGGGRQVEVWGLDGTVAQALHDPELLPPPGTVRMDAALATALNVKPGDRLVLRVSRPSALGRDVALSKEDDAIVGMSVEVGPLLASRWPADLSLRAGATPPDTVLVDLKWLQARLGVPSRVNRLLAAGGTAAHLLAEVKEHWDLPDVGLSVVQGAEPALVTDRVLLDDDVTALAKDPGASEASVWFVDRIGHADRSLSYAFIAAVDTNDPGPAILEMLPPLGAGDVALNAWAAEQLDVRVGDTVSVRYPTFGGARELVWKDTSFVVAGIVPMEGAAVDPSWMPPIEGLAGRATCREWNPGLPVDAGRVTDADEVYWSTYGGTPKAWVSLDAARSRWASPLGLATTLRLQDVHAQKDHLAGAALRVRDALDPSRLGLQVLDVSALRASASKPANDFAGLFAGFQFVLLVTAFALAAMQSALVYERRADEIGVMRAVGWSSWRVLSAIGLESLLVIGAGALMGVPAGALIARGLTRGLQSVWSGAVAGAPVAVVIDVPRLLAASFLTALVAWVALVLMVVPLVRRPPRALLGGRREAAAPRGPAISAVVAALALAGALALALTAPRLGAAEAFFGVGALALVGGLAAVDVLLRARGAPRRDGPMGGATRRPGRSLIVVGALASATFLVVGVGLGAGRAEENPIVRWSGTGGYPLLAQTSLPVLHTMDDALGAEALGLPKGLLAPGSVLAMPRVDGDDASCRQLGSARAPTLLGVDPRRLSARGSFRFIDPPARGWEALSEADDPTVIPVIGDDATVTWGLHLSKGDELTWLDGHGTSVRLRIVGVLANTVLQGALLMDKSALEARFPGSRGARTFLLDVGSTQTATVAAVLGRAFSDLGVSVVPTAERLDAFADVEDTYIAIFRALGALGLLLASAGMGLVLARTVEERQGELALARAIGFSSRTLRRHLVLEHLGLVVLGLALGVGSAVLAAWPVLTAPNAAPPVALLAGAIALAVVFALVALDRMAAASIDQVSWRVLARDRV